MEESVKVPVSFRLDPMMIDAIVREANARDMSQGVFVAEALREKFDRIEKKEDKGWGPLAGLDETDRARVVRFVACLRAAPKDRGFRRAVDANFSWLLETVARISTRR